MGTQNPPTSSEARRQKEPYETRRYELHVQKRFTSGNALFLPLPFAILLVLAPLLIREAMLLFFCLLHSLFGRGLRPASKLTPDS